MQIYATTHYSNDGGQLQEEDGGAAAVMIMANGHSIDDGLRWSTEACIGEGNGIPIAFLCIFFSFLIPLSLASDLICVGLEFWMVMGCFCSLDSCFDFFFLKRKKGS